MKARNAVVVKNTDKMFITERVLHFFLCQKLDVRQFAEVVNVQLEFSRNLDS